MLLTVPTHDGRDIFFQGNVLRYEPRNDSCDICGGQLKIRHIIRDPTAPWGYRYDQIACPRCFRPDADTDYSWD